VLIYDAACPLCRRARVWLEARIPPEELLYLDCRSEERQREFPYIKEDVCLSAMQLVQLDGQVLSGSDALPALLRGCRGWRWAGAVLSLPPFRWLTRPAYALLARNRLRLSALIWKDAEQDCTDAGACSRK